MKPMLCRDHPIDRTDLVRLLEDEHWGTQQKLDGSRLCVSVQDGQVEARGRYGQPTVLHGFVSGALGKIFPNGHFVFDGELMRVGPKNSRYVVFDMPVAGDLITPETPYAQRYDALTELAKICSWEEWDAISLLPTATTHLEKVRMVRRLTQANAEGVIVRRLDAPYQEGRRSPDVLKFKYIKTVDCRVKDANVGGKKNFLLELVDEDGKWHEVGKVSALEGDGPGIRVGCVVQVRYLYTTSDNRLYQPTYPVLRTDKKPDECTLSQLVYTDKSVLA